MGSIFTGIATPTESAAVGAVGALLLAYFRGKKMKGLMLDAADETIKITCMVMMILIGAQAFGLVFRGMGGDEFIQTMLLGLNLGKYGTLAVVMLVIFLIGFFLVVTARLSWCLT